MQEDLQDACYGIGRGFGMGVGIEYKGKAAEHSSPETEVESSLLQRSCTRRQFGYLISVFHSISG